MDIDTGVLATTIVSSFLFPYLKLGLQKIGEKITDKLGGAAADQTVAVTKNVWDRVKASFSSERDQNLLSEFEDDPEASTPLIVAKLKKKLEEDRGLAEDLHQLINATGPDGVSSGAQIMNAHIAGVLDARGANFSNSSNVKLAGVMFDTDRADMFAEARRDESEDK